MATPWAPLHRVSATRSGLSDRMAPAAIASSMAFDADGERLGGHRHRRDSGGSVAHVEVGRGEEDQPEQLGVLTGVGDVGPAVGSDPLDGIGVVAPTAKLGGEPADLDLGDGPEQVLLAATWA